MYKGFYVEFWSDDNWWHDTKIILHGSDVEKLVKSCRERGESVRVRRMDTETEQLDITYCYVSDQDRDAHSKYTKQKMDKRIAENKKLAAIEPLTDEQVDEMLARLTNHFGCPVRPVNKYCEALSEWAHQIRKINEEAGENSDKQGRRYYQHLRKIMMDIRKSNLLWRLIYADEKLRTEPCPIHKGKWGGCSFEGCIYGCGETGWLPQ